MNIVQQQWYGVLAACICGLALGALYDAFWLIRQHWRSAGLTFFLDVLFSMTSGAALFILAVSIFQQRMRGFLPVSMLLGGILWELTAGRWVRRFWKWMHKRAGKRNFSKKS